MTNNPRLVIEWETPADIHRSLTGVDDLTNAHLIAGISTVLAEIIETTAVHETDRREAIQLVTQHLVTSLPEGQ